MNIAVASADFATVTAHGGHARRFLVFETESGATPRQVARIELPTGMAIHDFSGKGPHPLDKMGVIIVGSAVFGWYALPPDIRSLFTGFQVVTLLAILGGLVAVMLWLASSFVRADEQGLTFLCSAGDFDALITGDMAGNTEKKLVEV